MREITEDQLDSSWQVSFPRDGQFDALAESDEVGVEEFKE
jgi:hypothetical protein